MKPARMRLLHKIRPPNRKQQLKKLIKENELSIWVVCLHTERAVKSIKQYLDPKDRTEPPQQVIDDVEELVEIVKAYRKGVFVK